MNEFLAIILRLSIMYLYALAVIRLTGKRTIGNLSAQDFITALIVGDLFDNIFWGTSPMANGLLAISVITGLHVLTGVAAFYSRTVRHVLIGEHPVVVVKNGRFQHAAMRALRTSEDVVYSALRNQGEENLVNVREAYWEGSGALSVILRDEAKPAQKADLPRSEEIR